jgi:hypothetical protein
MFSGMPPAPRLRRRASFNRTSIANGGLEVAFGQQRYDAVDRERDIHQG